jgi:hypothetical protein
MGFDSSADHWEVDIYDMKPAKVADNLFSLIRAQDLLPDHR